MLNIYKNIKYKIKISKIYEFVILLIIHLSSINFRNTFWILSLLV